MREEELAELVARRLPADLALRNPVIRRYPDEVVVMLQLDVPAGSNPETARALIARRREETRVARMQVARELEGLLGLPVAWGVSAGGVETLFTTRTAPVMTRLGRAEREVLDTLIAAGVADTRSSALAYLVRTFAVEHAEWIGEVRQVIAEVERVRARLSLTPRPGAPPPDNEAGGLP